MRKILGKLNYANVMATVAVFIALGGASYAAIRLPKNSVGTKQIKNRAITGAKIKNGAISGAKLAAGAVGTVPSAINAIHATNADTATRATSADTAASADTASRATTAGNAATLGGSPASAFAPANLIRSAVVEGGTVIASESVGISQANLITNEPGVYCIGGLSPPPVTAIAAIALGPNEIEAQVLNFELLPGNSKCQIYVETRDSKTNRIPGTFTIMVR